MPSSRPKLSLIIPTGPGDTAWRSLFVWLTHHGSGHDLLRNAEVIMVPCETVSLLAAECESLNLQIINTERGRALQQNVGAENAIGDYLWFLHADTELSQQAVEQAEAFIQRNSRDVAYFNLRFASDGPALTILNAIGANLRSRLFNLPFGDQGFLVAKSTWNQVGPFNITLKAGEDLDWVVRARRSGFKLIRLSASLRTSARKYQKNGWLSTTWHHVAETIRQYRAAKKRLCIAKNK